MRVWLTTLILALAMVPFHDDALCSLGLYSLGYGAPPENSVDETDDESESSTSDATTSNEFGFPMPLNVPLKTTGGAQLWTDHLYRDGYRLQQNALTGHWRVLDESDVRRAWGNREQCAAALDGYCAKDERATESPSKHIIVLLHGLMRTNRCMIPLENSLKEAGYENVIRYSYASTRSSMGDHAAALREMIEDLPDDATFSFVGHSMGNIVVRHMIGDLQRDSDPKNILPRCKSMVMLGPPNQGAMIAKRLAPTGLYGFVTGKGGLELGPEWDELADRLGTPPFPFAIVAGDVSHKPIKNPLVAGKGDFIVSLEEAELEGREAFHCVPVLHSFLMDDEATQKICVDFIDAKVSGQ